MTLLLPRRQRPEPGLRVPAPFLVPTVEVSLDEPPVIVHAARLFTPDAMVLGTIEGRGRLSDILNRRDEILVDGALVCPIGAPRTATTSRASVVIDPFELDLVIASAIPDAPWTRARRIAKRGLPVRIDAEPWEIEGVVHLLPGREPASLMSRSAPALFVPVTEAVVRRGGRLLAGPASGTVLLNRTLVRDIRPQDHVTDIVGMALARRSLAA